jgi:hypothetical protein
MLRVIANHNREIRSFNTLEELFDPRKFELWRAPVTVQLYVEFLKSLYTRENVRAHPKWLFPSPYVTFYDNEKADRFIEILLTHIPEDKLWTLNFLTLEGLRENCPYYIYFTAPPGSNGSSGSTFYWYFNDQSRRSRYSFLGDNFAAEIMPCITMIHDSWTTAWQGRETLLYGKSNYCSRWSINARLLHMMLNLHYATQNGGPTLSTERVCAELVSNPDARITVSFSLGDEVYVKINSPITNANRSQLYTVFQYTTNPLNVLKWPLMTKGEHKPRLYGVELEVSTNYNVRDIIDACDDIFMLAKMDSSIRGSCRNAMELVTVPMSLKKHKLEWAKWFNKLDYDQFDCTNQTTNGMHVHIDREAFETPQHLRNFTWFITAPENRDFIFALSERDITSFQTYSPVPQFNGMSKTRSFIDCINQAARLRGAVNVGSGKGTVEVRLFKGIVSYASVLKNLEAVDAIFEFTRDYALPRLTLRGFLAWLNDLSPNRYKVLRKFLDTIDVEQIEAASRLTALLKDCTTPKQIADTLNGSKITITQDLVTALNKTQGKRTFIFNKETKTIEVWRDPKKYGKVSQFDRILEKQYLMQAPRTPSTPAAVAVAA